MTKQNIERLKKLLHEITGKDDSLLLAIASKEDSIVCLAGNERALVQCLHKYIESEDGDQKGKKIIVGAALGAIANDEELLNFCMESLNDIVEDVKRIKNGERPKHLRQIPKDSNLN